MHASQHKQSSRKISPWNAFVSAEFKKRNGDRDRGDRDRVSSNAIKALAQRWAEMSQEERVVATQDIIEELVERRKSREQGFQNMPLCAFNDVRANIASIRRELENLNGRTGTEFFLVGVRSQLDHFNPPYVFYTSERILQFVELINNMSLQDFALRLEAYCVAGIDSLKKSISEDFVELKRKVSALILQKLQAACTRANISKMFYVNFHEHITVRYGIVIEGWPLPKFTAPGNLGSRHELFVLYQAWENDAARFRQLPNDEWEEW
ncbi:hypothetical protein BV20DRAFT_948577, partial [Pilatotrama ljubarskyi]